MCAVQKEGWCSILRLCGGVCRWEGMLVAVLCDPAAEGASLGLPYKKVFPSFAFLLIFSYIREDDSVGHSKGDFNVSIVINFS